MVLDKSKYKNILATILKRIDILSKKIENKKRLNEYKSVRKPSDSNILGNLAIEVYSDDRKDMTPHCHVSDIQTNIELEVSLVDCSIINVKGGGYRNWSYYTDIEKRFFAWCNTKYNNTIKPNGKLYTNLDYAKEMWNKRNKDSKYAFDVNGDLTTNKPKDNSQEIPLAAQKIYNNLNNKKKKKK